MDSYPGKPGRFSEMFLIVNMTYIRTSRFATSSSGFAAIGYFRTSPYDGIYIIKNYSKLTAKNPLIFIENPFFLPKTLPRPRQNEQKKNYSNRSTRFEGDRFQTYKYLQVHI